jgi:hypothetical protein
MMNKSKIENMQPESQPNDAVKADGLPSAQVEQNPMLYAVAKKIVMEYWIAELSNGEKISLKTNDVAWLDIKDGQPINGKIVEKEVQDKYADGEYARSYSVHKWFEVDGNGI